MLKENHVLSDCPPELRDQVVAELLAIERNPPWDSAAGMAAPQIGYPYNLFVAQGQVFEGIRRIMPVDRTTATGKYMATEGCFSVPHEVHAVQRYTRIRVRYDDGFSREYNGFLAQVIQHEFDHIRGKLINDKKGA